MCTPDNIEYKLIDATFRQAVASFMASMPFIIIDC